VRDSLLNWFRKDGYQVRAVGNATEALRALQDERVDVALLDIKMPGMDGMELQEHIHRIDPQIAVIMITAFASVETAVRALKQGAFDYVTKPIDPDELSHLVRRALEQRHVHPLVLQRAQGLGGVPDGADLVAVLAEPVEQRIAHGELVVDDEDAGGWGRHGWVSPETGGGCLGSLRWKVVPRPNAVDTSMSPP
jgi:DNA-binding response OmpR family regulator